MQQYSRKRLEGLSFLKLLAFLGVFISHAGLGSLSVLGAWGVSVFIVMSGYLMIYNYYDRDTKDNIVLFAVKKIKPLYPLYIVSIAVPASLSLLVMLKNNNIEDIGALLYQIFFNAFLIQAWIPNSSIYFSLNSVAWYLSMCLFLYFVFLLILKLMKRINKISYVLLGMIILFLIQIIISLIAGEFGAISANEWFSKHWITYIFPISRLCDFMLGCLLGCILIKRPRNTVNKNTMKMYFITISIVILLFVSWLCYFYQVPVLGAENVKYSLLFVPTSIGLVWLFSKERIIFHNIFCSKPLLWLSELTPYAFLIHLLVIRYLGSLISRLFDFDFINIVPAVVCFVITIFLSWLYKKYFISLIKKKS